MTTFIEKHESTLLKINVNNVGTSLAAQIFISSRNIATNIYNHTKTCRTII